MTEHNTNEELVGQYKTAKEQGNTELADAILWRIIEQNMPMVYNRINTIALEKSNINEQDKEDMAQESMIALMEAVETYNEKLARFNTYAYDKVQFKILDWLEKNHLIHIPRRKQRDVSLYQEIISEYKRNNNDREPSDAYIKKMMGVGDNTYRDIKAALFAYNIISLDDKVEQEEDTVTVGDTIPDERDYYLEKMIQNNREKFLEVIMKLKSRDERRVLIDYYYNDIDLVKIAENRGVSKQRINTIKKKAHEHLAALPEVKNIAIELGIKPLDS